MSIISNGQITLGPNTDQLILRKISHFGISSEFAINLVYPNPFNPVTTIQFTLPMVETSHAVSIQIYDITGTLVETLMDEKLVSGQHTIKWNGTRFSSGVYFLKLEAGSFSQVEKLMLIK
jgi:flagellar hook assembly protein FlgD